MNSESEQDWQPVVIAPPEVSHLCCSTAHQRRNITKYSGKLLCVRPNGSFCYVCGGRSLDIHVDSVKMIAPDADDPSDFFVCESQVLAD